MRSKIIFIFIMCAILCVSACKRYVVVDGGDYFTIYHKGYKGISRNYYPLENLQDSSVTKYQIVYATMDYKSGGFLFDTIPFTLDDGKVMANEIYEIYYYKGQPRLTKKLGRFYDTKHIIQNANLIDYDNWNLQNKLGLIDQPPMLNVSKSSASSGIIGDTICYTVDDVEYVLYGGEYRNFKNYGLNEIDSLFYFLRKDGIKRLSARPEIINVKLSQENRYFAFWASDFNEEAYASQVIYDPLVDSIFSDIPNFLINIQSSSFIDANIKSINHNLSLPLQQRGRIIFFMFKDGHSKTVQCPSYNIDGVENSMTNNEWLQKFIYKLNSLSQLQNYSTSLQYIGSDSI